MTIFRKKEDLDERALSADRHERDISYFTEIFADSQTIRFTLDWIGKPEEIYRILARRNILRTSDEIMYQLHSITEHT